MKVLIDISKEVYDSLNSDEGITWHEVENILACIGKGKILSEEDAGWVPADASNLPKGKVIYKLFDGRMGVGELFAYEFFCNDECTVCVRDDYGDHPNVIKWAPLPC